MRKPLWTAGIFLITASAIFMALVRTDRVRIFSSHFRTDNELDQVTVDHFRYSDYVRGIKPKPMAASDVYFGYFGGPDREQRYILLSLPRECASEKYILDFRKLLVTEGHIWAAGPLAIWWHPQKVRNYATISLPLSSIEFNSPSCGPIRFMIDGGG